MEWFEMDDSPYTFAALTTNANTDGENFNKFVDAVQAAKNVRSHIAGVFYYWQQGPDHGIECALNTELHRYDFVKCGTTPRTATIGFVIKPSIETDPEVEPVPIRLHSRRNYNLRNISAARNTSAPS